MGEMFVARESGPELVGRMGNHSAVANNNQIIAGIRAGVFEAVVNAFESMQGKMIVDGNSTSIWKAMQRNCLR